MTTSISRVDSPSREGYRPTACPNELFCWSEQMLISLVHARTIVLVSALGLLFFLAVGAPVRGQDTDDKEESKGSAQMRAQYTKYEFRIPMRDGAKLYTACLLYTSDAADEEDS